MQNKQKTKKSSNSRVDHKKKKVINQGKFRKGAPVIASSDKLKTQKDSHVSKSKSEITKVINKSIEAQMLQRAKTGNERLSVLKA